MHYIDEVYRDLVEEVLAKGIKRETRNGTTLSLFGTSMKFDIEEIGLPLLSWRKIFTKGVVGEFLGFLQDAKTVEEFEALGCPYWKLWADDEGKLELDYPPREQWDNVIQSIKNDPMSRRHIINVWDHKRLDELSLPCCHFNYQFYVRAGKLDLIWTQRSLDIAVGLPSDLILACLYLEEIGQKTGLKPGRVTMNFGDSHIYEEHIDDLTNMIYSNEACLERLDYVWDGTELSYEGYEPNKKIQFLLKG